MTEKRRAPTWEELYPGRFIQGADLKGQLPVVVIDDVWTEEEEGVSRPGRISFRGKEKHLPLNKTNGLCLSAMFGRQPSTWIGKSIVLDGNQRDRNPASGEMEQVVRIWGSPDIMADIPVTIARPRRKAYTMTMRAGRPPAKGAPQSSAPPPADREPGSDDGL